MRKTIMKYVKTVFLFVSLMIVLGLVSCDRKDDEHRQAMLKVIHDLHSNSSSSQAMESDLSCAPNCEPMDDDGDEDGISVSLPNGPSEPAAFMIVSMVTSIAITSVLVNEGRCALDQRNRAIVVVANDPVTIKASSCTMQEVKTLTIKTEYGDYHYQFQNGDFANENRQ